MDDPTSTYDCWGCDSEPGVDGALGDACRTRVAQRKTDPSTPRLNVLIERLDDVYTRACWHCQCDVATTPEGLCPNCHRHLRA